MPNYKVFQDSADSMRVKIYGVDASNAVVPLVTNTSGKMDVVGTVGVSGNVGVSGTVGVSGAVNVASGVTTEISGTVGVSGTVSVSGNVGVSGTVAVSGDSGSPLFVNLFTRNTKDSGLPNQTIASGDSGAVTGVWDVLGYNGWTLAVKYSGVTPSGVQVKLQMSAIGSGAGNWVDDDGYKAFSGGAWNYFTTTYHVRYAQLYYQTSGGVDGDLITYLQAEY